LLNTPADLVLGFNRLSILDLSINGHQPMISLDGKVVLMMNGEIYNAFDFKNELIARGCKFKSTTDTEVVLHLYQTFGMDGMIRRLNGMFALSIYDFDCHKLFLARDRLGIKPLYIFKDNGRMAFSSEIKSFKAMPDCKFELEEERLNEFVMFRNVVNRTLIKNIENCTPGTFISIGNTGVIKKTIYFNINEEGTNIFSKNDSVKYLEQSLLASVNRQMLSDVKLGCQLSGGVDSSLIAFYASALQKKGDLDAISIIFKEAQFSEETYIDFVTKKLSLSSHRYELGTEYYLHILEKATWHFEQPLNHPNSIGLYLLSEKARQHVSVLLSGEGADELLAGYDHFLHTKKFPFNFRYLARQLKLNSTEINFLFNYYSSTELRMIIGSTFGSISASKKIKPDFNLKDAVSERLELLSKLKGDAILKQRKYEILTFLPDLLMRQDKMSMAHSIENRVPFLDNEMLSASLSIPGEFLINRHCGKYESKVLLKKLCAEHYNEAFSFRKKMGFGVPLKSYLKTPLFQEKWKNQIQPNILKRGIFESKDISNWVRNIGKATPDQIDCIWLMTTFHTWAQQYLD
jgi:asparagine synthase (glutamine-hydrolysing)